MHFSAFLHPLLYVYIYGYEYSLLCIQLHQMLLPVQGSGTEIKDYLSINRNSILSFKFIVIFNTYLIPVVDIHS